ATISDGQGVGTVLRDDGTGPEFRVNSSTYDQQRSPSVAKAANGDFVVAWENVGQDGDGYGVYAQRYHAHGTPQGTEFPVNPTTDGPHLFFKSLAMDPKGDFVVCWTTWSPTQIGDIVAQRFSAIGWSDGLAGTGSNLN